MKPRKFRRTLLLALSLLATLFFAMVADGAPLYTITVNVNDVDAGSVTLYPIKTAYAKNNVVTLTAVPTPGTEWTFDRWSGALSGTQNPTTLRVGSSVTVTANFIKPGSGGGTDRPPLPASRMIVGYFAQWAIYQRDYRVKNVDSSGAAQAMNVMNYAFAAPDASLRCVSLDPFADHGKAFSASESVDGVADTSSQALKGNFNQILKLKARHPHLRVLLSLGGWTESTHFSDAALETNRAAFVQSCIDTFMRGNVAGVFDGFDVDWEYPGSCGATCNWRPEDQANFPALLTEFRTQLDKLESEAEKATGKRPEYLLTVATSAGAAQYSKLNLAAVAATVDWVNVMAYDFHGAFEPTGPTNHAAPLYQSPCDTANADWGDKAILAYLAGNVPASKLLLGVPFYGHGWRGVAAVGNGLCQSASGLARGTYERGTNDYKVLDAQLRSEFSDPLTATHWTFNGSEFWSFDDEQSLDWKADYVNQNHGAFGPLRGVMFWELSGDGTDGRLLKALRKSLSEVTPTQ